MYYAYFEPYSWERHLELLGRVDASPRARVSDLGATVEGRDLDLVTVGTTAPGRKALWVIARQHPGETMAEWFVEGLLERALDPADPVARRLLEAAVLYVVPNMNPDGSVRGNLRTNAAGANLNREWMAPSLERSPEVFHVRAAMQRTGVDAFLDVHGDEGLPYVFTDGNERLPTYSPRMAALEGGFATALVAANPDFQTEHGYPSEQGNQGQPDGGVEVGGTHVRRARADARDAVQGQRRPAGSGARLERRAVAAAGRRHADGAATRCCRRCNAGRRGRTYTSLAAARNEGRGFVQTILVANPKGGSGKTTLATNIAGWLAGKRQRVGLQDADPQGSSTQWLARRPALFPPVAGFAGDARQARS